MQDSLNETHDARARSWVASANEGGDFPIQNLPLGVFRRGGGAPRGGVAIGDQIVDLNAAIEAGLFEGEGLQGARAASGPTLNPLLELPATAASALRRQLFNALLADGPAAGLPILVPMAEVEMQMPIQVGAFTDFLSSWDHANRVSRGDMPPAFDHLPVGYSSRASSVTVARDVRRPLGHFRGRDKAMQFGPEPMLDFELEIGVVLRGGNPLGAPMSIREAGESIFGYCLLNDWSARGLQFTEQQPLGPFLGKSFATSISPWIVTAEALAPFRARARRHADGAPVPAPHLMDPQDQASGNLDVQLEALISTAAMRAAGLSPTTLVRTNATASYWTFAQMATHLASNGCNLQPGDLFGSGTLSGPTDEAMACLVEWVVARKTPIELPSGERRTYLEDGDEMIFRGRAQAPDRVAIGFGECRGRIAPAPVPVQAEPGVSA